MKQVHALNRMPVSSEEFPKIPDKLKEWLGQNEIDEKVKDAMIDMSEFLLKRNTTFPDISEEIEAIFEMMEFDISLI